MSDIFRISNVDIDILTGLDFELFEIGGRDVNTPEVAGISRDYLVNHSR
ncbi:hypothetical protein ACOZ32_01145 (plasmid) [Halobacterium sp. MBLA0001]|uniref:Uncharacterized protein n=1 Tax=Halobacterium salinarum TaxID=2242 RepID=A0A841HCW5_HALSI|nr:hypothetical protein [Halobacterium salinarum]MBB6090901.1 hypothetical protein [Halobacterium salinarum]MDL0125583.1 hypothetical protein [Halobacterium salinarum]UEB93362.1 hypothetical protein LJ422_11990 [Halobacterium salinarum NRC-34001]